MGEIVVSAVRSQSIGSNLLNVICFSKDRPLQLEAFIDSLGHFSGLPDSAISVIYACSPEISYDTLIKRRPDVDWIAETDFQADLMAAVERAGDYVLLGCDDVVFKEYFDLNRGIELLATSEDVFGFTLRLGTNIRFMPSFERSDDLLVWDWSAAKGSYWRYCWEVSATLYRKAFVLDYLKSRDDLSNPNRFEASLAKEIEEGKQSVPPKLASFAKGCTVTVTVNRVQDEFPNEYDDEKDTEIVELYKQYEDGYLFDWPSLAHWDNKSVHTGAESFAVTKKVDIPEIAYGESQRMGTGTAQLPRFLKAKIIASRLTILVWETLRIYLPEKVLVQIRRVAKRVM
jgi:hypothetical protein